MLKNFLRKYFVMGSQNCNRPPEIILEEALQAGITAFQYREKGENALVGKDKRALGEKLRTLCHQYQVPFFVNDDLELALDLKAEGIHVGQDDMSVTDIRANYPGVMIGLSISNHEEMEHSPIDLVDYIGAGPIFSTTSKSDAKDAVGVEWISYLREHQPYVPIVGIGGITTKNACKIMNAGANGVAVVSAIASAENINEAVKML